MKKLSKLGFLPLLLPLILAAMMIVPILSYASQPAKVELGSTVTFAVLAGSAITNTGPTVITGGLPEGGGNIGVHPGSEITGLADITMTGWAAHMADAVAGEAKVDLQTAYNDAEGRPVDSDLTGQDLGDLTLTSGVYAYSTSALLTDTLTLDAEGDPDAVFIFQIGSTLTTASYSNVNLINGARFCRVFWQIGSSATLGTYSNFAGHIFAQASITANTSATIQGQLLALTGAVTLDTNTITNALCADTEITTDEISTDEVTTDEVTTDEVTTDEVTTDEVTTDEITTDEVTTDEVTTDEVTTDEVTTDEVTTDEVTTDEITTDEITTDEITTDETTTGETDLHETTNGETTSFPAVDISEEMTTSAATGNATTSATTVRTPSSSPKTGSSITNMLALALTSTLILAGAATALHKKEH